MGLARMRPPSHRDPNSLAAAASIRRSSPAQRERVFRAIELSGPLAEYEIGQALGIPGNSTRPRLVELMEDGRIERCGKGRTPSGRSCWLYKTKAKPVVLLQETAFGLPELIP